jgi:hypothetical protein
MHDEMDKLVYLRALEAEGWDLSALPPRRVAILACWESNQSPRPSSTSSASPTSAAVRGYDQDKPETHSRAREGAFGGFLIRPGAALSPAVWARESTGGHWVPLVRVAGGSSRDHGEEDLAAGH